MHAVMTSILIIISQALATLLVGDSSLSSLFLKANLIGDEGARAFKVVLLHSQALTTWVWVWV